MLEGVCAKVAIEELQKKLRDLDRHGDKGESDAQAAHIQSANRTARGVMMIHHSIRIPQHKDGGCGLMNGDPFLLSAVIGSDPYP